MRQWEIGTKVELNCEVVIAEKPINDMVKCKVVVAGIPQMIELPVKILREKKNKRTALYVRPL